MPFELKRVEINELKAGDKVYVKSLSSYGSVLSIKLSKAEAEILLGGNVRTVVKISDLYNSEKAAAKQSVYVKRSGVKQIDKPEINVVGETALDALEDVSNFIDKAVMSGVDEIKIIHGVGTGTLLKEIRKFLKTHPNVSEYRRGNYGEGENGVTIVKLK